MAVPLAAAARAPVPPGGDAADVDDDIERNLRGFRFFFSSVRSFVVRRVAGARPVPVPVQSTAAGVVIDARVVPPNISASFTRSSMRSFW